MLRSLICLTLCATPAFADLQVRFDEGAPTDRFTFTNDAPCTLTGDVMVDLSGSAAGLIFDTTSSGAGVQVFQPFRLVAGADWVGAPPTVGDGDTAITLPLRGLPPGQSAAFTIDLDDTIGQRETIVSGSEITGAMVRLSIGSGTVSARFDKAARATLPIVCASS